LWKPLLSVFWFLTAINAVRTGHAPEKVSTKAQQAGHAQTKQADHFRHTKHQKLLLLKDQKLQAKIHVHTDEKPCYQRHKNGRGQRKAHVLAHI
jgi:hypothetical protein